MAKRLSSSQKVARRAAKASKKWVKSKGGLKRLKKTRWTWH